MDWYRKEGKRLKCYLIAYRSTLYSGNRVELRHLNNCPCKNTAKWHQLKEKLDFQHETMQPASPVQWTSNKMCMYVYWMTHYSFKQFISDLLKVVKVQYTYSYVLMIKSPYFICSVFKQRRYNFRTGYYCNLYFSSVIIISRWKKCKHRSWKNPSNIYQMIINDLSADL